MGPLVALGFSNSLLTKRDLRYCVLKFLDDDYARLHLLEGAIDVVGDLLDLELLVDQLVLDLVDPDVQPLDVHLRVLCLGLCCF